MGISEGVSEALAEGVREAPAKAVEVSPAIGVKASVAEGEGEVVEGMEVGIAVRVGEAVGVGVLVDVAGAVVGTTRVGEGVRVTYEGIGVGGGRALPSRQQRYQIQDRGCNQDTNDDWH